MSIEITQKKLKDALKSKGAPLFTGDLNLTLVGIRSADTDSNLFNDRLCVLMQIDGKMQLHQFACTTDPGLYYRYNPLNTKGTAILKAGHYAGCWLLGAHQGKYKALVQRKPMTVFRDRNQDGKLDFENEESGLFGINLHKASFNRYSMQVDKWSAGCQVLANSDDFDTLMDLVEQSAKKYGERFSYTLLDEGDLQ